MQTFITDHNLHISARNLDNKRLGKQRVEALQIADCIIKKPSAWKNHPAVKMWNGYEAYLLNEYITKIFFEWEYIREFKNDGCFSWYLELFCMLRKQKDRFYRTYKKPEWITDIFIETHRSNLIRKYPEHYKILFPDTIENLEYIWPSKLDGSEPYIIPVLKTKPSKVVPPLKIEVE